MLAYENFAGGDEEAVTSAMSLIDETGSAEGMLQRPAAQRSAIDRFSGTYVLAIEIALATELERGLSGLEAKRLESRWRGEEEVAAIVDRELTSPCSVWHRPLWWATLVVLLGSFVPCPHAV